jgi:beta-galactosidase
MLSRRISRLCLCLAAVLNLALAELSASGQSRSVFTVDATHFTPTSPTSFRGGTSTTPDGRVLGMNSRYLTMNGTAWLPVMGEFHYTRVPAAQWEEEILKMKTAGVSIIAAYVIWIHHEEIEGQFDWTGLRDLRHFTELCKKHGMYVYPRVGPWAHGEVRNGGFPDWLLKKTSHTRQNDPAYLSSVNKYFAQIAIQLKGLLWKDGGPVIGIQIENEYAQRGPNAGEAHILQLKEMAIGAGLDVPIYSVTGWDNAAVPQGQAVAVFGGYPDAPWDASLSNLAPQEVYLFRLKSRISGNMGAITTGDHKAQPDSQYDFPFMTAEMGGGIQDTYHRRPIIQSDDVAAMVPVMLGSGVNLYGTYMFQGGENPNGKLTTLQESQETHYPTDVPVKSYDFQAPLGEFGQEREVFRKLKVFNYFMQDFGALLAPMEPHAPDALPSGPEDLKIARLTVRAQGDSGFLFLNNYVRGTSMPVRHGFQVRVKLPSETLPIPAHPIEIPSASYEIWPFNLQIGPARLRYATAQPFTRIEGAKETIYYFVATSGVSPEFSWNINENVHLHTNSGKIDTHNGITTVSDVQPSLTSAMTIAGLDGTRIDIVLLSQEQAENAWKIGSPDHSHLLFTRAQIFADEQHVFLQQNDDSNFEFQIAPSLPQTPNASSPLSQEASTPIQTYSASLPAAHPTLQFKQSAKAGAVPPVRIGPASSSRKGIATAPTDAEFASAAKWSLAIPSSDWAGVNDLFLQADYLGDVARLMSNGKLLTDNFYNGMPWEIGLRRFRSKFDQGEIELQILPLRNDSPIFFEDKFRPPPGDGQIVNLKSLTLVPQYQLTIDLPKPRQKMSNLR